MTLPPEQHRIIRHLAQLAQVGRYEVSEAMMAYAFGMEAEALRKHVDQLQDKFVSVERKMETQNRWLTLLPAGMDYAREHGLA